jgi:hypothetical protein
MSAPAARLARVVSLLLSLIIWRSAPATAQTRTGETHLNDQRPALLMPLYVSFAGLQVLDTVSTQAALRSGGAEANPLLGSIAGSPAALLSTKAAVTGAMIFASERLWKQNRVAAVVTMIGINSAYAMIAAHNYAVAGRRAPGR